MRKRRLFLVYALGLTGFLPIAAQLPDISTADSPKWYYIRVVGDEARANRVFTRVGASNVDGQLQTTALDLDEVGKQLWRFEKNSNGSYTIINMTDGQQLAVGYDAEEGTGRAVVKQTSDVTFRLQPLGNYYQIISSKAAEGTSAGEIYLHQGNSGYSYAVITVSTTYADEPSSQFSFVPFEDYRISYSDEDTEKWYQLSSNSGDFAGRVIKEQVADEDSPVSVVLETADADDPYAQWKAIAPAEGNGVRWVNKATGHVLMTGSDVYGMFNLIRTGTLVATGNVWTPTYLGEGQYAFSAVEDDNIERYLGAASADAETPGNPDTDKLAASAFSWTLKLMGTTPTGLSAVENQNGGVKVVGRRIVAEGAADLRVYNLSGMAMPAGAELQPGVYIVVLQGKSSKIIVR